MYIINLTQHKASKEQIEQGVTDLQGQEADRLKSLLTFTRLPTARVIFARARSIACLFNSGSYTYAMIGGAPYLMAPLEAALKARGIIPVYAYSERVSEEKLIGGKVVKTNVFKHLGFVEAYYKAKELGL